MLNKTRFIYLLLIVLKVCFCDETVRVKLKQGLLSGKVEKTFLQHKEYYAFKGVPYAQEPIGEMRFKPPTAHKGWDGVYEAHANRPTCLQFSSRMRYGAPFGISGAENCLYLSVFTPSFKNNAPVVVFDYNDNFRTGFNDTDTYSPDFFIEENVIVVYINHRLGAFGYLTTDDEVIPSNSGLKDFIFGLKWIKDNIKDFGGDPDRVTIMGNRGGAALVEILLYSNKAEGLFTNAIIQSGTAMEPILFYKNPRRQAFKLGELLNINANDSATLLQELQKLDANEIVAQESNIFDEELMEKYQLSIFPFSPTIESNNPNAVLTFLPEVGKIYNDVPVLIGMNSREGLDLISHFIFEPRLLTEIDQDFLFHFPIRSNFRFDRKSTVFTEVIKEIQDFYLEEGYLYYGNILDYAVYVGDILQNYALDYAVNKIATDLKSPVYYYMFDFRGQLNENSEYMSTQARSTMKHWGATIGDELCYLHFCSRIRKKYEQLSKLVSEQAETKVLKKMVRLWTNFIKTGHPTPTKDDNVLKEFTWHPIDKDSHDKRYLHITKALRMKVNPLGERKKFWDEFLTKYSQLAVDGVVGTINNTRDEL